jgi:hypothetical protein
VWKLGPFYATTRIRPAPDICVDEGGSGGAQLFGTNSEACQPPLGFWQAKVQSSPVDATSGASPCDVIQINDDEASADYLSHPMSTVNILLSPIDSTQLSSQLHIFCFVHVISLLVSALLLFCAYRFDSTLGYPGEGPNTPSPANTIKKNRPADWTFKTFKRLQKLKVDICYDFQLSILTHIFFFSH